MHRKGAIITISVLYTRTDSSVYGTYWLPTGRIGKRFQHFYLTELAIDFPTANERAIPGFRERL